MASSPLREFDRVERDECIAMPAEVKGKRSGGGGKKASAGLSPLEPLPAVDGQRLPDDVARLFAGQEHHRIGDVVNVGDPASRDAADHGAVEPAGGEIGHDALGGDMAGGDAVDASYPRTERGDTAEPP